jgi:hypothetical protein
VQNQIEVALKKSLLSLDNNFVFNFKADGTVVAHKKSGPGPLNALFKSQLESWARAWLKKNAQILYYYNPNCQPKVKTPDQPIVQVGADGSISVDSEFPWLAAQILNQVSKWIKKAYPCLANASVSFDKYGQLSISGPAPAGLDIRGFLIRNSQVFENYNVGNPLPYVKPKKNVVVKNSCH